MVPLVVDSVAQLCERELGLFSLLGVWLFSKTVPEVLSSLKSFKIQGHAPLSCPLNCQRRMSPRNLIHGHSTRKAHSSSSRPRFSGAAFDDFIPLHFTKGFPIHFSRTSLFPHSSQMLIGRLQERKRNRTRSAKQLPHLESREQCRYMESVPTFQTAGHDIHLETRSILMLDVESFV